MSSKRETMERAIEVLGDRHRHRCKGCKTVLDTIYLAYIKYSYDVARWNSEAGNYQTEEREAFDTDWEFEQAECPKCGAILPDEVIEGG